MRTLSKDEAEEFGGVTAVRPESEAQQGFGLTPDRGEWQPAPGRWPGPLQSAYDARVDNLPRTGPRAVEPDGSDLELVPGLHFKGVGGKISAKRRKHILRAIDGIGIKSFLARDPFRLGPIVFKPDLADNGRIVTGKYYKNSNMIGVNSNRDFGSFGHPYNWGEVEIFSQSGRTRDDVMAITLAHEIGHHILRSSARDRVMQIVGKAFRDGKADSGWLPVSTYARQDPENYFCECLAAYRFHRQDLQDLDPSGYNMVVRVVEYLQALR